MMYSTLDLIACPICKHFPLVLYVFSETKRRTVIGSISKPFCKVYCGLEKKYITEMTTKIDCIECLSRDILWGLLCCPKCRRRYLIFYGVPLMYPGHLPYKNKLRVLNKIFMRKVEVSDISC